MSLRKLIAAASIGVVAIGGVAMSAGAAGSTFTVSDTSITVGETVTVHLTTPCVNDAGDPDFGNVIMSSTSGGGELSNQETKFDHFIKGATGEFSFPGPGTYTITRFCDATGQLDQVTITVSPKPTTTTSTSTTSTTAAPTSSTTTTTAKAGSSTTTAAPTTTVATSVAGVSETRSTAGTASSSSKAAAATAVSNGVSYTG